MTHNRAMLLLLAIFPYIVTGLTMLFTGTSLGYTTKLVADLLFVAWPIIMVVVVTIAYRYGRDDALEDQEATP